MHISSLPVLALTARSAASVQTLYGQCGGSGYTAPTECVSGSVCTSWSDWYSQCVPGTASVASTTPKATTTAKAVIATPSTLVTVKKSSSSAKLSSSAVKSSTVKVVVAATSTTKSSSTSTSSKVSTPTAAVLTSSTGKTPYAGINIAGFDFGMDIWGDWYPGTASPPTAGIAQMQHFVTDDKLNAFRLPVGWEYLVGVSSNTSPATSTLDATAFATYDKLVQGCLATGALCIIDIHNYGRWQSTVVGQGGPSNDVFAALWKNIATKYASTAKVAFGIMNEPHDLVISEWATTVQACVTAIRDAKATSQYILLPGNDYTGAGTFISDGSAAALLPITNSDGTNTNLIFDVHRYFDSDGSGTNAECVTDHVSDSFTPLATWLRTNKRMAFVSEMGGGNTASCEQYVCSAIAYLNANADVYLGFTGWSAGGFDSSYALSMTPVGSTDTALAAKCFSRA